jgi:hypothetical protein
MISSGTKNSSTSTAFLFPNSYPPLIHLKTATSNIAMHLHLTLTSVLSVCYIISSLQSILQLKNRPVTSSRTKHSINNTLPNSCALHNLQPRLLKIAKALPSPKFVHLVSGSPIFDQKLQPKNLLRISSSDCRSIDIRNFVTLILKPIDGIVRLD